MKIVIGTDLAEHHLSRLRDVAPEAELLVAPTAEDLQPHLGDVDILIGGRGLDAEAFRSAKELRWYHHFGVGVDGMPLDDIAETGITVTNNRHVRSSNIAEHVLAMMLGFARGLPEIMRYQVQHEWRHADRGVFELGGQVLGVIGTGSIGSALAWRANALGMRVLGYRRRPMDPPRGVERVYSGDELHELLGLCDHVAICLPLTHETEHMFSVAEFAAMRESAYIYNIGRGPIIDQDALIDALRREEIAGAGLDVTDPEPLPADSPLWDMTNVQITCHTSGATPHNWDRTVELVASNLRRFLAGEELDSVVDLKAGY